MSWIVDYITPKTTSVIARVDSSKAAANWAQDNSDRPLTWKKGGCHRSYYWSSSTDTAGGYFIIRPA